MNCASRPSLIRPRLVRYKVHLKSETGGWCAPGKCLKHYVVRHEAQASLKRRTYGLKSVFRRGVLNRRASSTV